MTSSVLYSLLGLLAGQTVAQSSVITDDTYFYGQSPPVYPSPNASSTGPWAASYSKAAALVGQMSIDEKVSLIISLSYVCRTIEWVQGKDTRDISIQFMI